MLRELILPGIRSKDNKKIAVRSNAISPDTQITYNVLEILYWHINQSLQKDRSTFKLNMFEKGIVRSGLETVMPGTKKYIVGMMPNEIKLLLDDIERELSKRKRV
jgi:hypothetical protein